MAYRLGIEIIDEHYKMFNEMERGQKTQICKSLFNELLRLYKEHGRKVVTKIINEEYEITLKD